MFHVLLLLLLPVELGVVVDPKIGVNDVDVAVLVPKLSCGVEGNAVLEAKNVKNYQYYVILDSNFFTSPWKWILPAVPNDGAVVDAAGNPKDRVDAVVLDAVVPNENPVTLDDPNSPVAGLFCSLLSPEPVLNWNPGVGAAKT